jgi:hypothetical protein
MISVDFGRIFVPDVIVEAISQILFGNVRAQFRMLQRIFLFQLLEIVVVFFLLGD